MADEGFPGLVLRMTPKFAAVSFEPGDRMRAQAGLNCAQMVMAGLNVGRTASEIDMGSAGPAGANQ